MNITRFSGLAAGGFALIATLAAATAPHAGHNAITDFHINLETVSADSATDAWAAGPNGATGDSFVIHWNGTSWTRVAIPSPTQDDVAGLSALSPTDAWAVGAAPGKPAANGLTLHWDGKSWTQVPTPSPAKGYSSYLASVDALSASDAFAVGFTGKTNKPADAADFAVHWNGTNWTTEPVPSPSQQSYLVSVSADSPTDAWAIGNNEAGRNLTSYALHWNGTAWTQVPIPNPNKTFTLLNSVSARSSDDAWAVGTYFVGHKQLPLILHWNGTSWTQAPSPQIADSELGSVSAVSSDDAWAVGGDLKGDFVLHWNGTSWTQVPSPSPGGGNSTLAGVSDVSATNAWAVGCDCPDFKGAHEHTVVLQWNGTSWVRS